MRKGEELKTPRHASAAALCGDHITTHDIIPNSNRNTNNIKSVTLTPSSLVSSLKIYSILKSSIRGILFPKLINNLYP